MLWTRNNALIAWTWANWKLSPLLLARLARRFAHLTQRDMDVVRCVVEGLDTERLAQRLGISTSTLARRVQSGAVPAPVNGRWPLATVVEWEAAQSQHQRSTT